MEDGKNMLVINLELTDIQLQKLDNYRNSDTDDLDKFIKKILMKTVNSKIKNPKTDVLLHSEQSTVSDFCSTFLDGCKSVVKTKIKKG